MKKNCARLMTMLAIVLLTATAMAAADATAEKGKNLFNDPALAGSTTDKSCNSCHAGGQGLEKAGANPKLSKLINGCITDQLKAEKIDGRTSAMRALKSYIKSLEH